MKSKKEKKYFCSDDFDRPYDLVNVKNPDSLDSWTTYENLTTTGEKFKSMFPFAKLVMFTKNLCNPTILVSN